MLFIISNITEEDSITLRDKILPNIMKKQGMSKL